MVSLAGDPAGSAVVILVVPKCTWNALMALLGLPTFDDTDSLCYLPRSVIYRPSLSILVTASTFIAGNREAKLKPTTFSSLLFFRVFLPFIFSSLNFTPFPIALSFLPLCQNKC